MRLWESASHIFPYSLEQVVAVFWDRYPNSKAQHILSEDVIERKVNYQVYSVTLLLGVGDFLKLCHRLKGYANWKLFLIKHPLPPPLALGQGIYYLYEVEVDWFGLPKLQRLPLGSDGLNWQGTFRSSACCHKIWTRFA